MVRLGSTIAHLTRLKAMPFNKSHGRDRLSDVSAFGSNPGELSAKTFIPDDLASGAPLVVVLHGCTQTAEGYNHGSGWSELAQELGFALLFPEQQRSNNPNLCFNWFSRDDARRDVGEAVSIRQMIGAMVAAHDIDERRIFVTGLSAGGAMTSVMLATYPEIFAGGAIIAGLPFGSANSMGEAFARMRGQGFASDEQLGALVRDASDHTGPWPSLSIWHGGADSTVDPSNARRIIGQWRAVHGAAALSSPTHDMVDGCHRQIWHDRTGRELIAFVEIPGLGHGTPLSTSGPDACGALGPYMLEAGISSTRHIARSWGLTSEAKQAPLPVRSPVSVTTAAPTRIVGAPEPVSRPTTASAPTRDVGAIIESALRAAGLMR